jgi:tRNA (Thr-GGU) A37 N-methylase
MSVVRLLQVVGNKLEVADVDILDGTPLLDLKPYVPEFDCHSVEKSGWLDQSSQERSVADGRFTEKRQQEPGPETEQK